jgi:hypothetical protein
MTPVETATMTIKNALNMARKGKLKLSGRDRRALVEVYAQLVNNKPVIGLK